MGRPCCGSYHSMATCCGRSNDGREPISTDAAPCTNDPYVLMAKSLIEAAAKSVYYWAQPRGLLHENACMYGLCPDFSIITRRGFQHFDIGIAVPDGVEEDHLVSIRTIPAGLYAVLHLHRNQVDAGRLWGWFSYDWPKQSGASIAHPGCYERYPNVAVDPYQVEYLLPILATPRLSRLQAKP